MNSVVKVEDSFLKTNSNAYYYLTDLTKENEWEDKKIVALFTDKNKKIIGSSEYGSIDPEELNANVLLADAIRFDAEEIVIGQKVAGLTTEESQKLRSGFHGGSTPQAHSEALKKESQVKAFAELSQKLKKKDIILSDIFVYYTNNGFMQYSDNVSRTLFPGVSFKLSEESSLKGIKYSNKYKLFYNLKDNNRYSEEAACQNMFALFLDNEKTILKAYEVPVDHNRLIPGVVEKQKCVFKPIFKEAFKQNAQSVVLIQNTKEYDAPEVADAESCVILKQARQASKDFDIVLEDYLVLGSYDYKKNKHNVLSFVQTYGMK